MVYRPFRCPQPARECINIKGRVMYRRQGVRTALGDQIQSGVQ